MKEHKMLRALVELKRLQAQGKGKNTVFLSSTDAPYHFEERTQLVFLDDMTPYARVAFRHYQEKVYDYPSMTLDEVIEKLGKGENIWGGLKCGKVS